MTNYLSLLSVRNKTLFERTRYGYIGLFVTISTLLLSFVKVGKMLECMDIYRNLPGLTVTI